jgi:hypothetical protein
MEAAAAPNKQFVQDEDRLARWVALAAGLGAILYFVASAISAGALSDVREGSAADFLVAYSEDPSQAGLIPTVMRAVSFLLMAVPLFYLFQAARRRSPQVRRQFIGFFLVGPLLIAVQLVLINGAITDAGDKLVEQSPAAVEALGTDADVDEDSPEEELADDLLEDSSAFSTGQYLGLVGYFSFGIAMLYAGLWAMRTGLLTRFSGSFIMALGVVFAISLVIPPLAQMATFGTVLFMLYLAFVFGRNLESRPPAWRAGEAIPWPKPGEAPPDVGGPGGDVEGSGREVLEPPLPEDGASEDGDAATETQGEPRKKRKRRD